MLPRRLRVVLVWRGEALEERTFSEAQPITIGTKKGATFTIPDSRLGHGFVLFRPSRDSAGYVLNLAPGMGGKISVNGHSLAVSEFLRQRHAGPEGLEQPLGASDWGIIALDQTGDVAFFFQFTVPSVALARPRAWLDRFLGQAMGMSAIVHVALLIVAFILWEPTDNLEVDPPPTTAIAKILYEAEPQPEKAPKGEVRKVREQDASKRAAGKEGKVGNQEAKGETKIPRGPKDQIAAKVSQMGLLGVMKQGKQSGALKSLLSDTNADVTTAMAGLKGTQLVIGHGSGGMSTRGEGQGGGGKGPGQLLGVGNLAIGGGGYGSKNTGTGGGRVAKEVSVGMTTGTPTSEGGLTKEQIYKVVASHQMAIRFCYEKELQRFPHLSGKVNLNWKVNIEGRVELSKIDSTSLNNPSAESCMVRQVKAWTFPKSPGTTTVFFPFLFKSQ